MVYVRVKNPIRKPRPVGDGICEVELTKGYVALIDEADAVRVGVCSWCVSFNGRNDLPYAKGRPLAGETTFVRLHRYLLSFPKLQVDHINGKTLDNRRANLRLVTQSQNMANTGVRSDSSTGLKGVSRQGSKFAATCLGKYVGVYDTAVEAAIAYDAALVEAFGVHARTNEALGLLAS